MGISVSLSSVAEPPGPESVMLARFPAHVGSAGRAKTKEPRPSASAVSGQGEVEGEELVTVGRPCADPVFTGGIGEHGRGVDHEGGVQVEFAVGVCTAPTGGTTFSGAETLEDARDSWGRQGRALRF